MASKISTAVYNALEECWKESQVPPSLRKLCSKIGNNSTSHVRWALDKLVEDGLVVKSGGKYMPTWVKVVLQNKLK